MSDYHPALQVLANMKIIYVEEKRRFEAINSYRVPNLDEKQQMKLIEDRWQNCIDISIKECPDVAQFRLIQLLVGSEELLNRLKVQVQNGYRGLRSA